MTIYANNNKFVIKNGKLASSEECCCCKDKQTVFYSRVGPSKPADQPDIGEASLSECACPGHCVTGEPVGCAGPVLCCGQYIDSYIRSNSFSKAAINLDTCQPAAKLMGGCQIDDYGTIGGINIPFVCGEYGTINQDTEISSQNIEVVDNNDGTFYLKTSMYIQNGTNICGPYGIPSLTIKWFFKSK